MQMCGVEQREEKEQVRLCSLLVSSNGCRIFPLRNLLSFFKSLSFPRRTRRQTGRYGTASCKRLGMGRGESGAALQPQLVKEKALVAVS